MRSGGSYWEARKYLVLMASIVVEGSPNKSTPDQLGVAMLDLQVRSEPALSESDDPRSKSGLAKRSHEETDLKTPGSTQTLRSIPGQTQMLPRFSTNGTSPFTARVHGHDTPIHPHMNCH